MKRSRFSDEQIISILKEHQAGLSAVELCCKKGVSDATFYKWRSKYGGMDVSETKRLKTLEDENTKLSSFWRSPHSCAAQARGARCEPQEALPVLSGGEADGAQRRRLKASDRHASADAGPDGSQ